MAIFQTTFYAQALSRLTTFHAIIPNDGLPLMIQDNPHYRRPPKTLYLLHGYSGCSWDWLTGSLIQDLALKYNLAVVLPSGDNSFYLNGRGVGSGYETFIAQELVAYTRRTFGLSDRSGDTFIGGLSMGGFGAIHSGLKYPETFGRMFGLSSALIVNRISKMAPGGSDEIADYDYYVRTFGELSGLTESENNPEYLVRRRRNRGEEIQPLLLACGTADFMVAENREFKAFLDGQGVTVDYRESEGMHDWRFWNEYLEPAIGWCLDVEA